MFDFSNAIDLPLLWGGIIALAVFLYVLLDGFDLGIGILFPFAPDDKSRDRMMNSIAPIWDGNETWLILGGGGLFAAFPLAYAVVMPAIYMPILLMLVALIFRGVAFEFRFKAGMRSKPYWDYAFHFGSLFAAFAQGVILGAFVQGIEVADRAFSGAPFDWLSGFSLMTGIAVVFGYALLGATWLIMKTDGYTQDWARKCSFYLLIHVIFFMGVVSLWVPFLSDEIAARWFSWPNIILLSPVPLAVLAVTVALIVALKRQREYAPFFCAIGLFVLAYIGLAISLWPLVVPPHLSLWDAAASGPSQSLMLVGVLLILPINLAYTAYNYYVFRGKTGHEPLY